MVLENAHTMPMLFGQPEATPLDCNAPAGVKAPTLVITGSETLPMWRLAGEAIARCIPGASLAVIQGVGHDGTVDAKDAFVELALNFIDAH
jgi:pimeloyl-ACP methyl ester carboxylesterase